MPLRFISFFLLMISQPAFFISIMIVDEQFSLLSHFVDLNTTYYYVPLIGKIDVWSSWEVCFVVLLVAFESVFIWSMWSLTIRPRRVMRIERTPLQKTDAAVDY